MRGNIVHQKREFEVRVPRDDPGRVEGGKVRLPAGAMQASRVEKSAPQRSSRKFVSCGSPPSINGRKMPKTAR